MFPARIAELLRFEPVLVLFPVLRGCVVPVFAIAALQCDDFAHIVSFVSLLGVSLLASLLFATTR
jgi:hypothetical protein